MKVTKSRANLKVVSDKWITESSDIMGLIYAKLNQVISITHLSGFKQGTHAKHKKEPAHNFFCGRKEISYSLHP